MISDSDRKQLVSQLLGVLRNSEMDKQAVILGMMALKRLLESIMNTLMRDYISVIGVIAESAKDPATSDRMTDELKTHLLTILKAELEDAAEVVKKDQADIGLNRRSIRECLGTAKSLTDRVTELVKDGMDIQAAVLQSVDECVTNPVIKESLLAKLHMLALATPADADMVKKLLSVIAPNDSSGTV